MDKSNDVKNELMLVITKWLLDMGATDLEDVEDLIL